MGAVSDYVEKRRGVTTRLIEKVVSVNTNPTRLLDQNPRRFSYVLSCISDSGIYIGFSPRVSAANGLYVSGNGGSVSVTVDEDDELTTYELWAISETGGSLVYIAEVVSP
ncbi:MAG: hypothetical protein QXT84_02000 [Candidatus Bathyarchaeia archaeon]